MKKYFSIFITIILFASICIYWASVNATLEENKTWSGTTWSGMQVLSSSQPEIDYTTMKYYDGTFSLNGQTYGNSLYDSSTNFSGADLTNVKILSYDEYMKKVWENQWFQTLSAPTNGLVGSWDLNGNAIVEFYVLEHLIHLIHQVMESTEPLQMWLGKRVFESIKWEYLMVQTVKYLTHLPLNILKLPDRKWVFQRG